ncbi:serine hydrolase [Fusobacterium sp. PH5-44]|uniref:serine hydrolase n=1 Tax=unclassified Fusobacterium TaxID=2648384 RepID=UPI003D1FDBC7
MKEKFENLNAEIREIIDKYSGIKGLIFKDSFGNTIEINENEVFPSASVIKLFILGALDKSKYNTPITLKNEDKVGGCGVLKVMNDGVLLTVRDICYLMITLSDNTATNMLIDFIGFEEINRYIKENNFNNTVLGRKMMDAKAREEGKDNYTSPMDVFGILNILYKDPIAVDMMKNQACNNKLPLYFAREMDFAHKTGELMYIEHDVGRMFFGDNWVDIIVLTKDLLKNEDGIKINSEIGKLIFDNYS